MASTDLLVASFYRFAPLAHREGVRKPLRETGAELGVKGTILLASEGLNGTVAGEENAVREYLEQVQRITGIELLNTKFSRCREWPFRKLLIRLKKEIVTMKVDGVDPVEAVGEYVEPGEWNEVISTPGVTVIDTRNFYEVEAGTFEGALNPATHDFWEFPQFVADNLPDKDQPIAMFCTGGIRCEKATSYLISQGYSNVKHLRGGVLNYLERVHKEQSLWRGSLFVFDEREALDHDLKPVKS